MKIILITWHPSTAKHVVYWMTAELVDNVRHTARPNRWVVWKRCNIDKSRVVGFPLHIATFIPPFIASVREILIMAWRDPVVLVAIIGVRGIITGCCDYFYCCTFYIHSQIDSNSNPISISNSNSHCKTNSQIDSNSTMRTYKYVFFYNNLWFYWYR